MQRARAIANPTPDLEAAGDGSNRSYDEGTADDTTSYAYDAHRSSAMPPTGHYELQPLSSPSRRAPAAYPPPFAASPRASAASAPPPSSVMVGAAAVMAATASSPFFSTSPAYGNPPTPATSVYTSRLSPWIDDPDRFFTAVYMYWHEQGMRNYAMRRVFRLARMLFTFAFAVFMYDGVDYAAMRADAAAAVAAADDGNVSIATAVPRLATYLRWSSVSDLSLFLIAVFAIYFIVSCVRTRRELKYARNVSWFYRTALALPDAYLVTCPWSEVASAVVRHVASYERLSQPVPVPLDDTEHEGGGAGEERGRHPHHNHATDSPSAATTAVGAPETTYRCDFSERELTQCITRCDNYIVAVTNDPSLLYIDAGRFPWWLGVHPPSVVRAEPAVVPAAASDDPAVSAAAVPPSAATDTSPPALAASAESSSLPSSVCCGVPMPWGGLVRMFLRPEWVEGRLRVRVVLTRALEWVITHALVHFVFTSSSTTSSGNGRTLRSDLLQPATIEMVRRRFLLLAFFQFLLSPFIVLYLIVEFVLEHGDVLRGGSGGSGGGGGISSSSTSPSSSPSSSTSSWTSFNARRWSTEAQWMFRQYNELPHALRARLARATPSALRYTNSFPWIPGVLMAQLVAYCLTGAIVLLLVLMLVVGDDVVTRMDVAWGRSGLWWLTVLTATVAALRTMVPSNDALGAGGGAPHENGGMACIAAGGGAASGAGAALNAEGTGGDGAFSGVPVTAADAATGPRAYLRHLLKHLHYWRDDWVHREHCLDVRDTVFSLFPYGWYTYARELLSVVFGPPILACLLAPRSEQWLRYIATNTVEGSGQCALGGTHHVCRFSMLHVEWNRLPSVVLPPTTPSGGGGAGGTARPRDGSGDADDRAAAAATDAASAVTSSSAMRSQRRKVAASLLGFQSLHPTWPAAGMALDLDETSHSMLERAAVIGSGAASTTAASTNLSFGVSALERMRAYDLPSASRDDRFPRGSSGGGGGGAFGLHDEANDSEYVPPSLLLEEDAAAASASTTASQSLRRRRRPATVPGGGVIGGGNAHVLDAEQYTDDYISRIVERSTN